jgi:hypothetical protein
MAANEQVARDILIRATSWLDWIRYVFIHGTSSQYDVDMIGDKNEKPHFFDRR